MHNALPKKWKSSPITILPNYILIMPLQINVLYQSTSSSIEHKNLQSLISFSTLLSCHTAYPGQQSLYCFAIYNSQGNHSNLEKFFFLQVTIHTEFHRHQPKNITINRPGVAQMTNSGLKWYCKHIVLLIIKW